MALLVFAPGWENLLVCMLPGPNVTHENTLNLTVATIKI